MRHKTSDIFILVPGSETNKWREECYQKSNIKYFLGLKRDFDLESQMVPMVTNESMNAWIKSHQKLCMLSWKLRTSMRNRKS